MNVSHLISILAAGRVMTLATRASTGEVYATPLYYALVKPSECDRGWGPALLFASDPQSRHIRELALVDQRSTINVAAAVIAHAPELLDANDMREISGAQLQGIVHALADDDPRRASAFHRYQTRFPAAKPELLTRHTFYVLAIGWAKVTDNRQGFARHPQWNFSFDLAPNLFELAAGEA